MSTKPHVDWDALRKYGPCTITCRCGRIYRSLAKAVVNGTTCAVVTEIPCPGCKAEFGHVVRMASDPETWTIHGGQV